MRICKICRTSNEEEYTYCKNCGNKMPELRREIHNQSYAPQNEFSGLVPIIMELPDPFNPGYRSNQTVYVTPAQKAAILYDINIRNNSQEQ